MSEKGNLENQHGNVNHHGNMSHNGNVIQNDNVSQNESLNQNGNADPNGSVNQNEPHGQQITTKTKACIPTCSQTQNRRLEFKQKEETKPGEANNDTKAKRKS